MATEWSVGVDEAEVANISKSGVETGRRWTAACCAAACWLWKRLCVRRRANVLIVLVDNLVVVFVAREEVGYGWCSRSFFEGHGNLEPEINYNLFFYFILNKFPKFTGSKRS